jgi:hypothetical protein
MIHNLKSAKANSQKASAVCALEPLWYVHKRRPIGVGDQARMFQSEVS